MTTVIGFLGSQLDAPKHAKRWQHWRPSIGICQQEDLLIDRLDLLYDPSQHQLTDVIVDDIQSVSPETNIVLHELPLNDAWDFEEVYGALHEFARGYEFDVDDQDYFVHITTGTHVVQICLFLLTESGHFPAKLLQASPPRPRNKPPFAGTYSIIDLDLSRYDSLASRFELEQKDSVSLLKSGIETKDPKFNELIEQIERVAIASKSPMLLTGPTGVGKTQLAKRIYDLKKQRGQLKGNLVEVNCATLRGDQAMSTLFGHVKGSYTGATTDRQGLLKSADGGMIFLDEIGELPLDSQTILLRAIEEKRFSPVGSDSDAQSDFQLIAGTNRDLQAEVLNGTFREDLLARINLWTFALPSLADRSSDIEPNVKYELQRFAETTGKKISINQEALRAFLTFATSTDGKWNANFRDLSAAITRMATLAEGGRINETTVSEETSRLRQLWNYHAADTSHDLIVDVLGSDAVESIDRFDLAQLEEVLRVCRESKSMAAAGRELFAVSRLTKKSTNDADRLRKYLQKFGISWDDVQKID